MSARWPPSSLAGETGRVAASRAVAARDGRRWITGAARLRLVPPLGDLLDPFGGEGRQVVGPSARDQALIDLHLAVDPGAVHAAAAVEAGAAEACVDAELTLGARPS